MGLWEDVRFAGRLLLKDKWFTLVAAVALALGIGVNATVFTFVNAVLIRGLPMPDSDRVMAMGSTDRVRNRNLGVSYLDFRDWRDSARTFDMLSLYTGNASPTSATKANRRSATTARTCRRRPRSGSWASNRCSAAASLPEDDRPGAAAGGADRSRRLCESLRQQPVGHRPLRAHQRRADDDHRRHARGLQVPVQYRSMAAARQRPGPRSTAPQRAGTGRCSATSHPA